MLRLFRAAMAAVLFCEVQQCAYTNRTKDAANQFKVVDQLIEKHERVKFCARLTRIKTIETLET